MFGHRPKGAYYKSIYLEGNPAIRIFNTIEEWALANIFRGKFLETVKWIFVFYFQDRHKQQNNLDQNKTGIRKWQSVGLLATLLKIHLFKVPYTSTDVSLKL